MGRKRCQCGGSLPLFLFPFLIFYSLPFFLFFRMDLFFINIFNLQVRRDPLFLGHILTTVVSRPTVGLEVLPLSRDIHL